MKPCKLKANSLAFSTCSGAVIGSLVFFISCSASANELKIKAQKADTGISENQDRAVDGAALQAQELAIVRLQSLLKKHRGKRQESTLLIRLAESQQQAAGILFRLSHGKAQLTKRAIDYSGYHKALRNSISTLTEVTSRYPRHEEINKAYFMRGYAFEELKDIPRASSDYLYLTKNFPGTEEAISAHLSLAQFAADQNKYEIAVSHLKEVEKFPEHRKYPVAIYKMAWAYHNLKNVSTSLEYIERHIRLYDRLLSQDETFLSSLKKSIEALQDDSKMRELVSKNDFLGASPEQAIRENSLMDAVVFYFEGTEGKNENYSSKAAHSYFEKLARVQGAPGNLGAIASDELGKMLLRYSKLLRSRDMEPELLAFQREMVEKEHARLEVVDIILTAYEHLQNRRKIGEVAESAKLFIKLFSKHPDGNRFAKAHQALLDTANMIQAYLIKAKGKNISRPDASPEDLASVYETFTQIVNKGDLRVPRVHFNLAETLFDIGRFEEAVGHYRWIVDRGGDWNFARSHLESEKENVSSESSEKPLKNKKVINENERLLVSIAEANLRSIAARYEALLSQKRVPRNLQAVAYPKGEDPEKEKLASEIRDWISWIDTHQKKVKIHRNSGESLEAFLFEAARTLYAHGYIHEAIGRLKQLVETYPASKFSVSAATLHIDTAIASAQWLEVIESADHYQNLFVKKRLAENKNDTEAGKFVSKVATLSADARYKLIEMDYKASQFDRVIASVDQFRKKYPNEARLLDLLQIAGTSARKSNDMEMAKSFYSELIERSVQEKRKFLGAYILRGQILETQYQLKEASLDYLVYLKEYSSASVKKESGAKVSEEVKDAENKVDVLTLRKKILLFGWISNDTSFFQSLVKNPLVCDGRQLSDDCNRYSILSQLVTIEGEKRNATEAGVKRLQESAKQAYQKSRNASGAERALWSLVALSYPQFTSQHFELINLVRAVVNQWDQVDPLDQYALLRTLHQVLPEAFRRMRGIVKEAGPLRASASQIKHRVEILKEIESTAGAVLKLKWAGVQAEVLSEIADLYIDFTQAIMTAGKAKSKGKDAGNAAPAEENANSELEASLREIVLPFEDKAQTLRRKAFELAGETGANPALLKRISETFFKDNPSQAKQFQHQADVGEPLSLGLAVLDELSEYTVDMKVGDDQPKPFAWRKSASRISQLDRNPENWNELNKSDRIRLRWYQAMREGRFTEVGYLLTLLQDKNSEAFSQIHSLDLSLMRTISLHEIGAMPEAWSEFSQLVQNGISGKWSIADELGTKQIPEWAARSLYFLTKASLQSFAKAKTKSLLKEIVDLLSSETNRKMAWSAMESEDAAAVIYAGKYTEQDIDPVIKQEIHSRIGRSKRFITVSAESATVAHRD